RGHKADLCSPAGGAARGRRVAHPVPQVLGAQTRRPGHRDHPWQAGEARDQGETAMTESQQEMSSAADVHGAEGGTGTATTAPADPHAIRRGLVTRTDERGEAKVQTVAQTYATTVEDLWDAVTNQERLPRWFAPVTGDLELGGRYQVVGNAGGTIESCEPPHRFRATWEFAGQVTWIAVTVSPRSEEHTSELQS